MDVDGAANDWSVFPGSQNSIFFFVIVPRLKGIDGFAFVFFLALCLPWRVQATDGKEQAETENLMLQQLKRLIKTNFDARKVFEAVYCNFFCWHLCCLLVVM